MMNDKCQMPKAEGRMLLGTEAVRQFMTHEDGMPLFEEARRAGGA
jgi:hypothetical protein